MIIQFLYCELNWHFLYIMYFLISFKAIVSLNPLCCDFCYEWIQNKWIVFRDWFHSKVCKVISIWLKCDNFSERSNFSAWDKNLTNNLIIPLILFWSAVYKNQQTQLSVEVLNIISLKTSKTLIWSKALINTEDTVLIKSLEVE